MKHSESLKNIAPAIRRAQAHIQGAIKDAKNPFFKSNYADLESCWAAVKDPINAEGLSIIQTMGFVAGAGPTLITTLLHESGEYISGEQPVCAKSDNPQDMGSAITYARRYGLSAMVSLIQVDDDGNSASGKKSEGDSKPTGKPDLKAVSNSDPGAYKFTVGKHFKDGKSMQELGQHGVDSWLKSMKDLLAKDGKPATGNLVHDMAAAEAFLNTRSHERGELPRGAKP